MRTFFSLPGRRNPVEEGTVAPIHGQQKVEAFKIFLVDLPRGLAGQGIAALGGRGCRAPIGRLADVIAVRACRIDRYLIHQTCLFDQVPEDRLRPWASGRYFRCRRI